MPTSQRLRPGVAAALLAACVLVVFVAAPSAFAQCAPRQKAQLLGSDQTCGLNGCRFGYATAISGDGNTAIVGAYFDNAQAGAAYIYTRSGNAWIPQSGKILPIGGSGGVTGVQYFGSSVSLSADGNTALIGAYGDNTSIGAAYIFVRVNGVWSQQGPKLTPTGTAGQLVYFGFSCSLSADGNTALIGAEGDSGYAGSAFVFVRNGATWTQQGPKLTPTGGIGVVQWFGSSVAIRGDGNAIIVGGYGDNNFTGAAYYFVRSGNAWTQTAKLTPQGGVGNLQYFGASVAISADGLTVLIGAYGDNNFVGAAYVMVFAANQWWYQQRLLPVGGVGNQRYGFSVALSLNGNIGVIGGPADNGYAGAVYFVQRPSQQIGAWAQYGARQLNTGGSGPGSLGTAVGLSHDGDWAIVGASSDFANAGSAYIWSRSCRADFNCQSGLNTQDIFDFLNAWLAGNPAADFNRINGLTTQDIFDYLNAWLAGC
ncbi:MAG TPA: GC-type dockerin domain-anchored protein [Phycisphaerales bacterium]|nr:GC-type dockerin domain-anchored protein [Phycisphaerales bacterium]